MLFGLASTVPLSADSAPGHRYMQLDTPYASILWTKYGRRLWDGNGIRQRASSVVELRLFVVVVVYTWSATVMSAALQNVTVIKPRGAQQKLLNI